MEASVFNEGLVEKRLEEVLSIPIGSQDGFWKIDLPKDGGFLSGRLFDQFRKKLTGDDLLDLRRKAAQSPGKTLTVIQKLLKDFPSNPALLMLSALCIYGINANSSNPEGMLPALKLATRDAATALICDGISLYNGENFLRLYRLMLERYKRNFDKLNKDLRGEKGSLQKVKLEYAESIVWFLDKEAEKALAVVSHLKKRTLANASNYQFSIARLVKAAKALNAEQPREGMGSFNAKDTISFGYGLAISFAHVPILRPLVDRLIEVIPGGSNEMDLRKTSIQSVQRFVELKLAELGHSEVRMRQTGRILFEANLAAMSLMESTPVAQAYEADPFLNLSSAISITAKLFPIGDQIRMVNLATNAMHTLIRKDQTKSQTFTEIAQGHLRHLSKLSQADSDKASPK